MSIIACLNRVLGRNGRKIKGNTIDVLKTRPIRKYKVPDGLKARVLELRDKTEVAGSRHRAHEALWFLLSERCPEVQKGQWILAAKGSDVFVVEVLA